VRRTTPILEYKVSLGYSCHDNAIILTVAERQYTQFFLIMCNDCSKIVGVQVKIVTGSGELIIFVIVVARAHKQSEET